MGLQTIQHLGRWFASAIAPGYSLSESSVLQLWTRLCCPNWVQCGNSYVRTLLEMELNYVARPRTKKSGDVLTQGCLDSLLVPLERKTRMQNRVPSLADRRNELKLAKKSD